jgi:hypothetical protein
VKRILGVMVAVVALGAVSVPSASADTSSGNSQTFTLRPAGATSAKDTILCHVTDGLAISNPHKSHHEPRNVNVIATITCSKTVPSITLTVRLYRNGKKVNAKTVTKYEKKYLKGNASAGCKGTSGTYQGLADVRVVFPPRYVPPVETGHLKSKSIKVNCWK